MVIPLHVKSEHSLGLGTSSVAELVDRAVELGIGALALSDLENLYGQVKFHHACRAAGIRAITGVELRPGFGGARPLGSRSGRLVLLARDRSGYERLCSVITRRRAGRHLGEDPVESVDGDLSGLVALSDDPAVIGRLRARAGKASELRLFVPVTASPAEQRGAVEAARALGVAPVADPDVVFAAPEDHELHELRVAMHHGLTISEARRRGLVESADQYLRGDALQLEAGELQTEAEIVAAACELDLAEARRIFPRRGSDADPDADSALQRISRGRLREGRRGGRWLAGEYERRLENELAVIRSLGFGSYFLVVADIVEGARGLGIEVAARGSAVGSLVAYLLGVSEIDPISHGLVFERFIHPRRTDLPDIDIDVASNRRDELLEWVFQHFGPEHVAMVSAHQTFRRRSAFREGLKALGMPLAEVESFCRRLPSEQLEAEAEELQVPPPGAIAVPVHLLPAAHRQSILLLQRLIGKPSHLSVHPGGVVIADDRIERYAPLERAPKGVLVTQYDMHSVAKIGLVKIDLLGNRCLSELQECVSLIQPDDADPSAPVLRANGTSAIPDQDEATLNLLREGRTLGVFQLESPAVRSVLIKVPVRGIADVMAALAIVRPGPASGDAKAAFIRRAHGEEAPLAPDPALGEILHDSYGLFLYEEDIIRSLAVITGRALSEADELRSAIHEAQGAPERLAALRRSYLEETLRCGLSPAGAAAVWDAVVALTSYSFNKAHASSYALLAWRAAFLKTHFPVAFGCATLNHHGGLYPLRALGAELARLGVPLKLPSVNDCARPCALDEGDAGPAIRIGLDRIKHLTDRSKRALLRSRREHGPFRSVADLLARVPLSQRELRSLVLCGACDDLRPLTAGGYPFAHEELLALHRADRDPMTFELFQPKRRVPATGRDAERLDAYCRLVRIRNELELLELHVTAHPMCVLRAEAQRVGCVPIRDLALQTGRHVTVAAIVSASRRLVAKGGNVMQFVTLEDEHGLVEAVLFPHVYGYLGDPVQTPGPFLVSGRVENDHGELHLVVSGMKPFHQRARGAA